MKEAENQKLKTYLVTYDRVIKRLIKAQNEEDAKKIFCYQLGLSYFYCIRSTQVEEVRND